MAGLIGRLATGWVIGVTALLAALGWAWLGPLPHDPRKINLDRASLPPSSENWFGTNEAGVDVFSATVAAALTSVPIALIGVILGLVGGTLAGIALSGRSWLQEATMRLVDLVQSFPIILVSIVVVALAGGDRVQLWLMLAIALINFPIFLRLVRAAAMVVRTERYVRAAEVMGASRIRVALRHIVPNVSNVVMAQASLSVGFGVLAIAALGYLGIGVSPPTPSWGALIKEGSETLANGHWWLIVFPSLAICLVVLAANVIARSLSGDANLSRALGPTGGRRTAA